MANRHYMGRDLSVNPKFHWVLFVRKCGDVKLLAMEKSTSKRRFPRKHFLKEWRNFHGYTLIHLAELLSDYDDTSVPKSDASLQRIEAGSQPYSEGLLNALADIYGVDPAELLFRIPGTPTPAPLQWFKANAVQREQIDRVTEAVFSFKAEPQNL
jgi:transcriptional regulator with XRE-family HTH domain